MFTDLHIHSTLSDSSRTPEEIVCEAMKKQVSLLSVCDHYTIDAYKRLSEACNSNGISYVIGIEMDANLHGKNHHILAYNFDTGNLAMCEFINCQHDKNQKECEAMIEKMSADYPQLSLADYRTYECPKDIGGWKYAHYAVEKGAISTYERASQILYAKYFKAGSETYSAEEFCRIVKQAGGVSVLAHPGNSAPVKLTSFLRDMHERGIEGVECFYPSHSKETIEICRDYCRKNNLRITCGSDCHGKYDTTEGFSIGSMKISYDLLDLKGIACH